MSLKAEIRKNHIILHLNPHVSLKLPKSYIVNGKLYNPISQTYIPVKLLLNN